MKIRFPFPVLLLSACMTNPFVRDVAPVKNVSSAQNAEILSAQVLADSSTEEPETTETPTEEAVTPDEPAVPTEKTEDPETPTEEIVTPDEPAAPTEETKELETTETPTEETVTPDEPAAPAEETEELETPATPTEETVTPDEPAAPAEETAEPETAETPTEETVTPDEPAAPTEETEKTETPATPATPAEETKEPGKPSVPGETAGKLFMPKKSAVLLIDENPQPVIDAPAVENKKSSIGKNDGEPKTLADRIQVVIAETQKEAVASLPSEIEGFTGTSDVADREANQKGAGFTRVYTDLNKDVVITVFVYNNQDIVLTDDVTASVQELLDKHLQEVKAMEKSGLYSGVKIAERTTARDLRWRREKFRVIEGDALFVQNNEKKKTVIMLASDKRLMSYVRVRFTYPRDQRWKVEEKKSRFMATVLFALREFTKGAP